ncbi:MAG: hypothetical protein LWW85_09610 [Marinilabiliales bacterium]|nr:hypothetical protein [Marinilabiliales bacterium]
MKRSIRWIFSLALVFAATMAYAAGYKGSHKAELWLTDPQSGILFKKQKETLRFRQQPATGETLRIYPNEQFQTMDGFGNCFTDGSATAFAKMSPAARHNLLKELFGTKGSDIGISYLRITLGASDLSAEPYTYDDVPTGEPDFDLRHFSIAPAQKELIPLLKEILTIQPTLKILASPWSAPTWMKTNNGFKGGSLKKDCFDVYARYFVAYIQAMKQEGIPIDAITIQNEPLHPGNVPSMLMLAEDQGLFIRDHLGPAFEKAGIHTRILLYDHNADKISYPISILKDPETAKYVDGSAFHLYGGRIEDLSEVHHLFPDKNLYFTEQWVGAPGNLPEDLAWHVRTLIIGASRNWCRNVLEWNMAADPNQDPHTVGGCDRCLGTITLDGDQVTRNPAYYILAHAAKFVRPGSVRIGSEMKGQCPNVAFKTPEGKFVLILQNDAKESKKCCLDFEGKILTLTLPAGAVGTIVW